MQDLTELLRSNPYPGRGIVVGKDCVYYWIMGRSANTSSSFSSSPNINIPSW